MVFGGYWGPRDESLEQAARRVAGFLEAIGHAQPILSRWYVPMANATDARVAFDATREGIAARFQPVHRKKPALGFGVAAWNESGRFQATLGMTVASPHLRNAATLLFDADPKLPVVAWRDLVTAAIASFDPDLVAVATRVAMTANPGAPPWTVGWLTFERGGDIVEHAERAP